MTERSAPGVGETFGGYRVESLLGRGGMGTVYLATHERLARKVALKVIAPELARDEGFRARFLRESQLAAALDHPNVIPIYDADEVDGVLYLAMRFVEGPTLQALMSKPQWRAKSTYFGLNTGATPASRCNTAERKLSIISRVGQPPKAAKACSWQPRKNSIVCDTVNSRYIRRL